MAGKILGDDPFAPPGEKPAPPRAEPAGGRAGGQAVRSAKSARAERLTGRSRAQAAAKAAKAPPSPPRTAGKPKGTARAASPTKREAARGQPRTPEKAPGRPAARSRSRERPEVAAAATETITAAVVTPAGEAEVAAAQTGAEARAAGSATHATIPPPPAAEGEPGAAWPDAWDERREAPGFGPSLDAPTPTSRTRALVAQIERRLKARLQPLARGEHAGEPQRLPGRILWRRWRRVAVKLRTRTVDEFGRDPDALARWEPLLGLLYRRYFRVEARGLGHIPDAGRALIVANHSGTLPYDAAMIMQALRGDHRAHREVRPLVEDFVFHFPYLGTLINRIGGVRACPENAERLLRQDALVAVFPEGIKGIGKPFRERYHLQRFGRGGFVKLALACEAPIIPTAVVGAEEIHPLLARLPWLARVIGVPYVPITPTFPALGPLGLIPLPSKWFIAFGEPMYLSAEYGPEAADDRVLVNRLAEEVRARISAMLDQLLAERRSVFIG